MTALNIEFDPDALTSPQGRPNWTNSTWKGAGNSHGKLILKLR